MMKDILETIRIEKETVSDDEYLITDVYKKNESEVEEGELLFSFETSKADVDVEANKSGIFYHNLNVGDSVKVGDEVAYITQEVLKQPDELFSKKEKAVKKSKDSEWEGVRVSSSAMELIHKHNLSRDAFSGLSFIRKKNVLKVIEGESKTTTAESPKEKESQPNYNDLIIIGGKGGAKMVIEAVRSSQHFGIKGIIDDQMKKGDHVMGIPVLGGDKELLEFKKEGYKNIVLSFSFLNNLQKREERYQYFKNEGFQFPNIIHHRATVEPSVVLGEGNIILANSMVGSEVRLGNVNYVNTGAVICHESFVGANNHFAPNSVIAGRVKVGSNNLIGMCVTTYFEVEIGNNNVLNNGYNVIKDIEDHQTKK
ncbi:biotin/lipoyl-containing protein [Rhodohalobacter sulfatireducens]|uniref:Lipoyl-binding domain-containing protein n=1 Tax=Rhodohalobacter sulfatireducens TaxID=2911366 RepID=A0ABS9KII0_9BACT|nr:biotin/lipoyl-containing protein [Rhodohalobacter sulfatireducens]MCG2590658.1 hypothetical protein [Rhodohalobacter sulfatireducens]